MSPPESWLVEAVRTQYDLDNILLEEVGTCVGNGLVCMCVSNLVLRIEEINLYLS